MCFNFSVFCISWISHNRLVCTLQRLSLFYKLASLWWFLILLCRSTLVSHNSICQFSGISGAEGAFIMPECWNGFPMFSFNIFKVSMLTLKSLVHFNWEISFYSSTFVLEAIFSPLYFWQYFQKFGCCVGLFLGLPFYFAGLQVCFQSRTICFCYYDSICNSRLGILILLEFVFCYELLWLSRVFCASIWILGFFFLDLWRMSLGFWWWLHWLVNSFCDLSIFTILILPINKDGRCSHFLVSPSISFLT